VLLTIIVCDCILVARTFCFFTYKVVVVRLSCRCAGRWSLAYRWRRKRH